MNHSEIKIMLQILLAIINELQINRGTMPKLMLWALHVTWNLLNSLKMILQSVHERIHRNKLEHVRVGTAGQESIGTMNVDTRLRLIRLLELILFRITEEEENANREYENLYYAQEEHEELQINNEDRSQHVEETEGVNRTHEGEEHTVYTQLAKTQINKPALNRRSRRRLAKQINLRAYNLETEVAKGDILQLPRHMSRPPGCSFLGSKATQVRARIGSLEDIETNIIVDSGSDITLISEEQLNSLLENYKVKLGQKINLIQVTGTSSISGYVNLDMYFTTIEGIVKITVEAYVVKGMSTPFILGNDFADQYSLSIIRKDGESYLQFGESERSIRVESSTGTSLIDNQGQSFKIRTIERDGRRSELSVDLSA